MVELFVAAVVSAVVEIAKRWMGTDTLGTYCILLVLSLVGGFTLYYIQQAGLWMTFLQITVEAAGIWALFVRRLPLPEN